MARTSDKRSRPVWLVAAALAWLIPGAGHLYLGRRLRAAVLFVAIGATFWTGVGMGGVMTIDRPYQPWWFTAQMMTGVHGLIGWYRQDRVYKQLAAQTALPPLTANARPDGLQMVVDQKLREKNIVLTTPTAGVARAYTGVAGMLNLLCVFDAIMLALIGTTGEPPDPHPEEGS